MDVHDPSSTVEPIDDMAAKHFAMSAALHKSISWLWPDLLSLPLLAVAGMLSREFVKPLLLATCGNQNASDHIENLLC